MEATRLQAGSGVRRRRVPPVGATVAVDVTSPGAPRRRALEDVFMHGQDCQGSEDIYIVFVLFVFFRKKTEAAATTK